MEPYVLAVDCDVPDLGLRAGDGLVLKPGDDREPVVMTRRLPPVYDRIVAEMQKGRLRLLSDHRQARDLAAAAGLPAPAPLPRRRARSPAGYLTRLK